jgi:predicted Zn finger-like uncharacterized protein
MQIVCPNCQTSYQVEASAVGPAGRSVRCARCRTVWFAANTPALAETAASHRADIAQFAAGADPGDIENWPEPELAAIPEPIRINPGQPAFLDDAPPLAEEALPSGGEGFGSISAESREIPSPALAPVEDGLGEDIETVAARRAAEQARRQRFAWPLSLVPTAALALLVLNAGLIGWRAELVRLVPQTASLYAAIGLAVNLRGLVLADVTAEAQTSDGVPVLLVQGRIVSAARRTVEVPRLRFAARDGNGNEIYSWTALPARSLLSPGESLGFQSRLAAPPAETRAVLVRFFNRRDLAASTQ